MSNLKTQLAQRAQKGVGQGVTLNQLVKTEGVRKRFEELLGSKAPGFISSLLSVVNSNPQLRTMDPQKVLGAAAIAAAMDLPIDPNLGFAYIVPYKNQPQFQIGYKGYIQLAMRTGQYKTINATHVYEGEIESYNRITGEVVLSEDGPTSNKIVGYIAYFKLINGFEKYEYWTVDQVIAHAKRFSQSYGKSYSPWNTDFDAMATKTVLKSLLSKYGILSIEMQTAVKADQAVIHETEGGEPEFEYIDATYTVHEDDEELPEAEEVPADEDAESSDSLFPES